MRGRKSRSLADSQPVPVAVRMGGKGEENVLPEILCQVYLLGTVQFYLASKVWNANGILETLKAGDALHLKRAFQSTRCKEASIAQTHLQRILQGRNRNGLRFIDVQHGSGLASLKMLSFGRNLEGVYFHGVCSACPRLCLVIRLLREG